MYNNFPEYISYSILPSYNRQNYNPYITVEIAKKSEIGFCNLQLTLSLVLLCSRKTELFLVSKFLFKSS